MPRSLPDVPHRSVPPAIVPHARDAPSSRGMLAAIVGNVVQCLASPRITAPPPWPMCRPRGRVRNVQDAPRHVVPTACQGAGLRPCRAAVRPWPVRPQVKPYKAVCAPVCSRCGPCQARRQLPAVPPHIVPCGRPWRSCACLVGECETLGPAIRAGACASPRMPRRRCPPAIGALPFAPPCPSLAACPMGLACRRGVRPAVRPPCHQLRRRPLRTHAVPPFQPIGKEPHVSRPLSPLLYVMRALFEVIRSTRYQGG